MFYRGNIQRRKLLKPRSHKKKKRIDQPEWDVSNFYNPINLLDLNLLKV